MEYEQPIRKIKLLHKIKTRNTTSSIGFVTVINTIHIIQTIYFAL